MTPAAIAREQRSQSSGPVSFAPDAAVLDPENDGDHGEPEALPISEPDRRHEGCHCPSQNGVALAGSLVPRSPESSYIAPERPPAHLHFDWHGSPWSALIQPVRKPAPLGRGRQRR